MTKSSGNFLKGASILAAAGLLSRLLGLFYKIPLNLMVGSYGNGIYGNVTSVYNVLLMVSTIGFPVAISKMISESVSHKDYGSTRDILRVAMFTLVLLGALSSLFLFFGADLLITAASWPGESYPAIMAIAPAPFIISICAAYRGFFQGYQLMNPTAISQIIEQIIRVFLGMLLCYLAVTKLDSIGIGVGGAVFGATAGGLVAAIFLWVVYRAFIKQNLKLFPKRRWRTYTSKQILKRLILISIPITLTSTIVSLFSIIDSFIYTSRLGVAGIDDYTATIMFGDFTNADTLINIPLVLSGTLAVAMIPAISESYALKDKKAINQKINMAIRVVLLVALPCCFGLAVLSDGIFSLLFPRSEYGATILPVYAFATIFMMLSNTFQSILQAINRLRIPLYTLGFAVIVRLVTGWIFMAIPILNINGISWSSIITFGYLTLSNYYFVKRFTGVRIHLIKNIAKPLFASIIMCMGVMGVYSVLRIFLMSSIGNALSVVFSIIVGAVLYAVVLVLTGGVTEEELVMFPASGRLKRLYRQIRGKK